MRLGLAISVVGHAIVLLWGLLSFSVRPLVAAPPESMPVDIVSAQEFSQLVAGNKNAPKAQAPKPQVDKVDAPKPAAELLPKVADKPEIKPAAEAKSEPKSEPKPSTPAKDKQVPAKPDPIAAVLKKEEKAAQAKAVRQSRLTFDPDRIAALLDKRDPRRQAATGAELNQNPTLGVASGSAPTLSQSEVDALRARLAKLWNPPVGVGNPQELVVKIRIQLTRSGKLASPPMVLTSGRGALFEAARDGAVRAIFLAQPYDMLRPENYHLWKDMEITFDPREMFSG